MEKITAEDAFEMIYDRMDFLDRSCYSEEAAKVREALESLKKLKEAAKVIASL